MVEVIPVATISLPLVVRAIFDRLTASSGTCLPDTVADRVPWVVLSTKFVAVTVLPECVNVSPPLWLIVPFNPAWVSVPPVIGKLIPPEEAAVAGATGLTCTPAVFSACAVDASSTRTVFLPVTVIVCADADPLGLAAGLAVAVGEADGDLLAVLEDVDELQAAAAATVRAARPKTKGRRPEDIIIVALLWCGGQRWVVFLAEAAAEATALVSP